MRKKQIASVVFALWLIIVAIFMLAVHQVHLFDLEIFFVVSFIGLLVIMEILEPRYVQPGCLQKKNYLLAAGIIIFLGIVCQAVFELQFTLQY